ncbi:MAG: heavy metal translocating P-type ATPase [Nibricoccus sp.]
MTEPHNEPGLQADQRLVDRGWLRIGAGAAIAGQVMVFSLAVNLSEISGWAYVVVHGILIASALGALAFLGGELLRSAWDALRERKVSIDLLFLVTLAGAFAGSLVSTFTRTGSVYYEVVAILIVVHTAGKMLGAKSRVVALRAVDQMRERFDTCEIVEGDGTVSRCAARDLPAGKKVRVAPGAPIPVDGQIVSGTGYVQESSMTGEWCPEPRGPGNRVLAGTYSVDGSFEILTEGGPRRLDLILETVRRAGIAPSRLQLQADRLMAWFLPAVIGTSVLTFAGWIFHGTWERALFNSMAVLLVACPCAMGLATPVAVWGGLARLASMGLVARTGDFLEGLSAADVVLLDKTGTLSNDALSVARFNLVSTGYDHTWLKAAVTAAEAGLNHPVAVALTTCFRGQTGNLPSVQVLSREIIPGKGIVAQVLDPHGEPMSLAIGEVDIVLAHAPGSASAESLRQQVCHLLNDKLSGKPVYVFVDGVLAGVVELEENWRTGMSEGLRELNRLGLKNEVLSGDPRAGEVLKAFSVEVRSGLTPAEKLQHVQELVASGRTIVYAGDGVNDAAAMSAAQASIAMNSGAELARASSMAVFAGDDLRVLPAAIRIARDVRRSIRINLLFAAGYNAVGMILAATGWLHPIAAALLMVGSSVFVSVNALRSSRKAFTNAEPQGSGTRSPTDSLRGVNGMA